MKHDGKTVDLWILCDLIAEFDGIGFKEALAFIAHVCWALDKFRVIQELDMI